MRIAVTGASGFVGRHVLAELATHGHDIVAVVRDRTQCALLYPVEIVELDIARASSTTFDLLGRPDVLIHLAWDGLPNYKALHHFEHELPMQYLFLRCMIEAGLKSLLVAGTCFEYGLQSGALAEDADARPNTPYGYAKDALRRQLQFLGTEYDFALTWARLFYLYGEGQPETSLLPQLRAAVSRGDSVFNMSGGEQLRDYLPVEVAAHVLVELALKHAGSGVVNVCAGVPISVRRLVESWIQKNGWTIALNFGYYPYPDYEPMAFWGDRTKLDTILKSKV